MKSLFNEDALNYTNEGIDLDHEIHRAIDEIIKTWVRAGYNIREIGLIAMMAANDITLEELLRMQSEISKKRTAESKARMMEKLHGNQGNIS